MSILKAALLSVTLQLIIFIIIRRLFPSGIIFYQGLLTALIVSCLHASIAIHQRGFETGVPEALLGFFMGYSFFFTIPTTVDRAYSVKFLQALNARGEMQSQEIKSWFAEHFLEDGAVEKRLSEQEATGTIIQTSTGTYVLTIKGQTLARLFDLSCRMFNCQSRIPSTSPDQS
ncbi:hypothetical protein [Thermomonas alba]|uniref:hypothetical protein n=1 Tax=Thermomonas alba TaxID=2888525 RepID=UPI001F048ED4|nr:hypothetical protein [Thermomonas alba]